MNNLSNKLKYYVRYAKLIKTKMTATNITSKEDRFQPSIGLKTHHTHKFSQQILNNTEIL